MARTIGNAGTWHFGIVLTTIIIAISIVSRPEFLLFKVWCLVAFGEAITSRNHRYSNLNTKTSGESIPSKSRSLQQFSALVAFYEGR